MILYLWIRIRIRIHITALSRYAGCTLLAAQLPDSEENSITECVEFLERNEFIRIQETGEHKGRYREVQGQVQGGSTRAGRGDHKGKDRGVQGQEQGSTRAGTGEYKGRYR